MSNHSKVDETFGTAGSGRSAQTVGFVGSSQGTIRRVIPNIANRLIDSSNCDGCQGDCLTKCATSVAVFWGF